MLRQKPIFLVKLSLTLKQFASDFSMANLNIDDILLLIHGEIATAVTSAEVYGSSPGIKLSNVRVRMGQEQSKQDGSENTISLDTERFPPAKDGWLIDVSYSPSEHNTSASMPKQPEVLPSELSRFLASTPVHYLSGIGYRYQNVLNQINIRTIQELASLEPSNFIFQELEITQSQLRRFQSLAHLALSIPAVGIPTTLIDIEFSELLDLCWRKATNQRLKSLSGNSINHLSRWLQQLELCLDNEFFNPLTFRQMLD